VSGTSTAPARGPAGVGPMRGGSMGGRPGGPMGAPMGSSTEKAQNFKASLRRFGQRLRPERVVIASVILLATSSVFLAVLGPKLLGNATNIVFDGFISSQFPVGMTQQQAVESLQQQGQADQAQMVEAMNLTPGLGVDFTALAQLLSLIVVIYVLSSILSWAQNYLMAGVTQRTMYRLREDVDHKLGRLPLKYFDTSSRGDVLSRVTNDIDNISTTLQQTLTQLITAILTVVGVLAMMFWISPLLAIISLITIPLSFGITMLIAKRSQPQFIRQWKWTGKLNGQVEEAFSGQELVKVFGHRYATIAEFDNANEKMYQSSFRAQFISGIIQPAMTVISNVNYVAIAVIGGLRVASGTMSLGDVQAFIQYSRQFTMPITQIAGVANILQSGVASVERVYELLDEPEQDPDSPFDAHLGRVEGRIAFEDVSFRYVPDHPLIEGFNLEVEPGQIVAIVGPTGAGKTTLVNLLMRFYDIDAGRITIDGISIMDLDRDNVRKSFGMVLQDTWLFDGTIRDNIAYGAENATPEQVDEAACAARVDHFVRTLPDGYDTVLTEAGENISAGERQLLTIARAFLSNPAVLILDEATSSVDTRTEMLIQEAMAELRAGRTAFVIAHRLSTIRNADIIIVLEEGNIVEQGDHDSLLAANGAYARLYRSQFLSGSA
jgi:ATP-binding cassette subfamily B multidrug efflux pump